MRTRLAAAVLAGFVVLAPAAAMADTESSATVASVVAETNQNSNQNEGDGDRGMWGLVGLLGLAGLAGLKKRNDATRSHDDHSTARR